MYTLKPFKAGIGVYTKETFFNNHLTGGPQLSQYDMLFHQPNFNPKAHRNDRRQPEIALRNIWEQEENKAVPSTSHLIYGRPKRKQYDWAMKDFIVEKGANDSNNKRIHTTLQWAPNLGKGKFILFQTT